jgi:hypothetical protein
MRLRKNIARPKKLEDEHWGSSKDPTKPAYPHLLRAQVVPFNPHLPPAAFPSLPFSGSGDEQVEVEVTATDAMDIDPDSEGQSSLELDPASICADLDTDELAMDDPEEFLVGLHPKPRCVPTFENAANFHFEDELATSDDDEGNAKSGESRNQCKLENADHNHLNAQVQPKIPAIVVDSSRIRSDILTAEPFTQLANPAWNDLSPAVQLAIIARLSQSYRMTKVYDMLGLYAQDVGDINKLIASYNHQRELEDHLVHSMQQDQLRGILRTDHSLRARGASEAYHEFQTDSYMALIQAEIDESWLQATQDEVNAGKRFLSERGIPRDMIGHWAQASAANFEARLEPDVVPVSPPRRSNQQGPDSGYASDLTSPQGPPKGREMANAAAANTQSEGEAKPNSSFKRSSKSRKSKHSEAVKLTASVQPDTSYKPPSNSPGSTEGTSGPGSSGRSRRHAHLTPRYQEAMAQLKLTRRGGELDSDYELSEESDEDSELAKGSKQLPRLRITADNRIIGIPAGPRGSIKTPISGSSGVTSRQEKAPQQPQRVSTPMARSPANPSSPMPLPRVLVPPKTMPKPTQPNPIATQSDAPAMSKFNQNLLGIHTEGNKFTNSLLTASERDSKTVTPWILPQPVGPGSLTLTDGRSRSSTVVPPAFSPITESFPVDAGQMNADGPPPVLPTPGTSQADRTGVMTQHELAAASLPVTPNPTSSPVHDSPDPLSNNRYNVTEAGSPLPPRRESGANAAVAPLQPPTIARPQTSSSEDEVIIMTPKEPARTSKAVSAPTKANSKLDPRTGNVILEPSAHANTINAQTPADKATKAPTSTPLNPLQAAGDSVKKATANLKSAAKSIAKSTLFPSTNASFLNATPENLTPSASASASKASSRASTPGDGTRTKKTYTKSEKQKEKEAARLEGIERAKAEKAARSQAIPVKGPRVEKVGEGGEEAD